MSLIDEPVGNKGDKIVPREAQDLNYVNTFIAVADDCPATMPVVPREKKAGTSIAQIHYDMLVVQPYTHRQEDILFASSAAVRNAADLPAHEKAELREAFFAKPQACLRTSPLPKSHGWGLHFDADGRAAAHAVGSADYQRLSSDPSLQQLKAMRSKRA